MAKDDANVFEEGTGIIPSIEVKGQLMKEPSYGLFFQNSFSCSYPLSKGSNNEISIN